MFALVFKQDILKGNKRDIPVMVPLDGKRVLLGPSQSISLLPHWLELCHQQEEWVAMSPTTQTTSKLYRPQST